MATIGRKTVPFENLEKSISDYCGGTGTMANFFKMLSKCKQDIIEQMGTDYSDETVLSLTGFISCVQSGVLCGRSDSFYIFWSIKYVFEPAYIVTLVREFLIPWDYGIFDFG